MSFGSFPLSSLALTPSQLSACEHAGYHTASDVLLAAPSDLNRKLKNLTTQNIQGIISTITRSLAPSTKRVYEPSPSPEPSIPVSVPGEEVGVEKNGESSRAGYARCQWVGTGDVGLDEALGGGLRVGTLTEITGESAAGKSHLCMVLALSAQLESCTPSPGGSIIITSERELPTDRLVQLAKSSLASHSSSSLHPVPTVKQLLDNIHVTRALDIDSLDHMLNYSLPWELEKRRTADPGLGKEIRLLILDSITALLRGGETSYSSSAAGLAQRSKHLCAIADKLKALAYEYDLAIVVINQVSDVFTRLPPTATQPQQPLPPTQLPQSQQNASSSYGYSTQFFTDPGPEPPMLYSTQSRWFSGQSQGYMKEASLGIVWANAVNTRIMMSRTGRRRHVGRDTIAAVSRKRLKRLESDQPQPQPNPNANEPPDKEGEGEDMVGIQIDESTPTLIRRFHVVFSPFAPPSTVDYIITPSGVHTLEGSRKIMDLASIDKARKKRDAIRAAIDDEEWSTGISAEKGIEVGGPGKNGHGDGGEVFDDLGQLPAEFWDGKLDDEDEDDGD